MLRLAVFKGRALAMNFTLGQGENLCSTQKYASWCKSNSATRLWCSGVVGEDRVELGLAEA
jgi:hypothetical protein